MAKYVQEISLNKIHPSKLNPRLDADPQSLTKLSETIKKVGMLQPIIVRPIGSGEYEVVVGERRFRAAQKAGLKTIPAVVKDYSDAEVVELNLIENVQRADLSAVEKGNSCKRMMELYPEKYPTPEAVGAKIGVSGTTVRSWLQLVNAPLELQKMVAPTSKIGVPRETGKIDWDTAVTITRRIKEPQRQVEVALEIAKKPIYRRQAREVISRAAKEPDKPIEELVKAVVEAPYELPFRLKHMQLILDGIKTQTSRKGIADPRIKVGAKIHAAIWEPRFADLIVTSIERKRLGEFTEEDAKREGGYTLDQFKDVWKEIHGEWNPDESVYVICFKKVE